MPEPEPVPELTPVLAALKVGGVKAEPPPVGFAGPVGPVVDAGALAACSSAMSAVTLERAEALPAGRGGNGKAGVEGDAAGAAVVRAAGLVFVWGKPAPAAFAEEPLEDAEVVDPALATCGDVAADTAPEGETVWPAEDADKPACGAPCRGLLKIASLIGEAYRSVKPL